MPDCFRALIVEDDPICREAVVTALQDEDFQCHWATDGRDAKEAVEAWYFDVVIADLKMPRRNGHAFAVELASRDVHPLIIVLTGIADARLVKDLIARGVDDVVLKPANLEIFAVKVRALCNRRRRLKNSR